MMTRSLLLLVLVGWNYATGAAETDAGFAARWDFDEGEGAVVRDASPNGNHGQIHGATWVKCGKGHALRFDGTDDYVSCGNHASLNISGPVSVEAWVCPEDWSEAEPGIVGKSFESYALTYYKEGTVWWYISSGGNNCNTPVRIGAWHHIVGTFDGIRMALYVNAEAVQSRESKIKTVQPAGNFLIGCIARDANTDPASSSTPHFKGMIDAVRVYNRALSAGEVQARYKQEAGDHGADTTWFDRLRLTTYCYFDQGQLLIETNYKGLFPLGDDARIRFDLVKAGDGKPAASQTIDKLPKSGQVEATFTTNQLAKASYKVRVALLEQGKTRSEAETAFDYPAAPVEVVSPEQKTVPPLPPAPPPPKYELDVSRTGGFTVRIQGEAFPVESSYSFPGGGANLLGTSDPPDATMERDWKVAVTKDDSGGRRVSARGVHYSIDRRVLARPNHVLVKDTITNISAADLGVILSNHINLKGRQGIDVRRLPNPTIFVSSGKHGLGLVALDDVYLTQQENYSTDGVGGVRTDKFALAAGASYTLEWAVYPNETGDYYDFINQVRKDEGLIRTVEGGFAFMDRREPPSREFVELRGLKYVSIGCLGNPPDDPGVSLEGAEFTEYPKESALLKDTFARTLKQNPHLDTMFHIAHSLYATNKPQELFPDSRVLDAGGKQTIYGPDAISYYGNYFSKERFEQGYRWFIFYPTAENTFGKALLKRIDFMLDEIGCNSMFADGFTHGYGGWYTYDRWDGHSAEIDPATKTLKRKIGAVNLLGQDVMVAIARKIQARGGVVIANSFPGTRTLHKENVLYCLETASGDPTCARLHLAPSVIGLGNPERIHNERDVYTDILGKLRWGGLYFYYAEKEITHRTVTSQMYPITVEEIHPGYIKGRQRLVTMNSGVYGWPGEGDLHFAYRYDCRGIGVRHNFLTTVDTTGPRTEVVLTENESAVLKKIPITLSASAPVNLLVEQYDGNGVQIALNGKGEVKLSVRNGDFPIKPNAVYDVAGDFPRKLTADSTGTLSISTALDGQRRVTIKEAATN